MVQAGKLRTTYHLPKTYISVKSTVDIYVITTN
jgi:hypothetical protein